MTDIITRKEAIAAGLTHYFTGKACIHGHICKRYVIGKTCFECNNIKGLSSNGRKWREKYLKSEKGRVALKRYDKKRTRPTRGKDNPIAHRERSLRWKNNNKERDKENRCRYDAIYRNLPERRIARAMRSRLLDFINSEDKTNSIVSYFGCSRSDLKQYLESKFAEGMSWETYGPMGWHIDHIRPCASFDLTQEDQIKTCFHYTNLQPLWWYENLAKGAKWDCYFK